MSAFHSHVEGDILEDIVVHIKVDAPVLVATSRCRRTRSFRARPFQSCGGAIRSRSLGR